MQTERRRHRRLDIGLPVAFCTIDDLTPVVGSTKTINVSAGGVYFGTDQAGLEAGRALDVELTIPPGQGHFPYEGRICSQAEVVRLDTLDSEPASWGVAAQFRDAPKLSF